MTTTDSSPKVAQVEVKVNGADLPQSAMDTLFEVEVETSLYLPSMFSMRFYDDTVTLIDSTTFTEGTAVEIKMKGTTGSLTTVRTLSSSRYRSNTAVSTNPPVDGNQACRVPFRASPEEAEVSRSVTAGFGPLETTRQFSTSTPTAGPVRR